MAVEKMRELRVRTILDHLDVIIARGPWVLQQAVALFFERFGDSIAQAVERLAQRRAPFLIPLGTAAGVTPAVAAPAFDAVGAAPRGVFDDLDFVQRRILREVSAVVG